MPSRLASASDRCFRFSCSGYRDGGWLRAISIGAWRSTARRQCKSTVGMDMCHRLRHSLITTVIHLLALVFFHLLLQESSCALAQLRLLPLHRKAALLLPLCRRCCNCISVSVSHVQSTQCRRHSLCKLRCDHACQKWLWPTCWSLLRPGRFPVVVVQEGQRTGNA